MQDHLSPSTNRPESLSAFRAALSDLIAAFREAVTVYHRRRTIRANVRRMADRVPF